MEDKEKIRTSFGPEEGEKEALAIFSKNNHAKAVTRKSLEHQIMEKSSEKKRAREMQLCTDREEEIENKNVMATLK